MKNKENRERNILKRVFLSELEVKTLERRMKESRSPNFSSYARRHLLAPVVVNVDMETLNQVVFQLNRIGNNLNQIAKIANQNKSISAETIEEVSKVCSGLDRYVKRNIKTMARKIETDYATALKEKN